MHIFEYNCLSWICMQPVIQSIHTKKTAKCIWFTFRRCVVKILKLFVQGKAKNGSFPIPLPHIMLNNIYIWYSVVQCLTNQPKHVCSCMYCCLVQCLVCDRNSMFGLWCGIFVKWPYCSLSYDSRAAALKLQYAFMFFFFFNSALESSRIIFLNRLWPLHSTSFQIHCSQPSSYLSLRCFCSWIIK